MRGRTDSFACRYCGIRGNEAILVRAHERGCIRRNVSEATHVSQPRVDGTGQNGVASPSFSHEEGGR